MSKFKLDSHITDRWSTEGIKVLTDNLNSGVKEQTLLGVTGSGKTFTMANVIQNIQKPTWC